MKKSTFLLFAVFAFFIFSNEARSQNHPTHRECGTMDWLETMSRENPGFRAKFAANERLLNEAVERKLREIEATPINQRTQATYTIPIVFHVVLTAGQHTALTDAMIMNQFTVLNQDYTGLNPDSTNIPAEFQLVRGHSGISFCMAQQTPGGAPTNGINRVTSATLSTGTSSSTDPIKSTAAGGADAWDPTRYVNIWLCNFTNPNLLGYATFPIGSAENPGGALNQQGVAVLAQTVPGGTAAPYNKGRTLTHELGHFFWLRHITGDATCGDDFVGDTPQQASLTGGCPSGAVASGCAASPNPPGKMYQNYMDYTDDACMTMFTNGQNVRSEQALLQWRLGLTTSNGCTPPASVANDARISIITTPANGSTIACSPITPVVQISNFGNNNLTSATINVRLNGGGPVTVAWTGNLAPGGSASVTLTGAPINPTAGTNTLKIHTTLPNGVADGNPSNDTATSVFTRNNGAALPFSEGFEGATFVPAGWTLVNPDGGTGNATWTRFTGVGAGGSANMARIGYYLYAAGNIDEMITPVIDISAAGNKLLSFDRAYRTYGNPVAAGDRDTLEVLLSFNCGATWTSVYKAWGQPNPIGAADNLATVPATGTTSFTPAAVTDWASREIDFTSLVGSATTVQARFKGTSRFGNNLHLDNINIRRQFDRDLTVQAVTRPNAFECGPFTPVATIRNAGAQTITSYTVTYSLDGGPVQSTAVSTSIAPGATANVTLGSAITVAAGNHTIVVCTVNPVAASGNGDQNTSNDCTNKTFTARVVAPSPVSEGFEHQTSFPSPGWSIVNLNAGSPTWIKAQPGRNSANSAFIDTYSDPALIGNLDFVASPALSVVGAGGVLADSVIVTWDLAHQYYPDPTTIDSFSVRLSDNCGSSFNYYIFNRGDISLAGPAGSNTAAYEVPLPAHWQRLRAAGGGAALANGNVMVALGVKHGYSNNHFIDNINIEVLFKRDLKVQSIDRPASIACSGNFQPQATVTNVGVETITAFNVSYSIDGGAAQTTNVTGANLARGASMQVNLNPAVANLATGQHTIRIYSAAPVTSSGTGDQLTTNDTLTKVFGIAGTQAAPLTEGFEGAFPPTGWAVSNPDAGITWAKAATGNASASSAFVRNFNYSVKGSVDDLYTPVLTYTGADSVTLKFDMSAATYNYPGTTETPIDTLEVLVTKDCGATFTSVWKKWGNELQTINDPNYPQTVEFVPNTNPQWRTEVIDLTTGFTPNGPVQVVFRNTNNFENNVYVDNVNLTTRTLPNSLKENGYLVLPSPFVDQFTIWHLQNPTNLRYASVYNSAGQLVWKQQYNGNALNQITVDLRGKPAGTYIVNLGYDDRNRNAQVKVVKL